MKLPLFFFLLALAACKPDLEPNPAPPAKGDRRLGMHVTTAQANNPGVNPQGYFADFDKAQETGMDVAPLTFTWNAIERTQNSWNYSYPDIAELFYPAESTPLSLCVTPIEAVHPALPADLTGLRFNNPLVVARFKALLDTLRKHMPNVKLNNLIIGNEVDLYLQNNPAQWADYQELVAAVRPHAKSLWGQTLPVGAEVTLEGLRGPSKIQAQALNTQTDLVVTSYYPLNGDFTMKDPSVVRPDVEEILGLYPNRRLFIEECGYASSPACNSTEAKQAEFIRQMFAVWDDHRERMPFVAFLWSTDLSEKDAEDFVLLYGAGAWPEPGRTAFKEYLRTTGLRTWAGQGADKAGFRALKEAAKARGW